MAMAQEPVKFSPRIVSRLDEEDEDEWATTLRPQRKAESARPRVVIHSRESSLDKVQRSDGSASPVAGQPPVPVTSRLYGSNSRIATGGVIERSVDPNKAASYGHHRQTSIVHGIGIHHSRHGSLTSTTSSPLSPQMIAAAGVGLGSGRIEGENQSHLRPPTSLLGPTAASDRAPALADSQPATQRLESMHSTRTRRDHARQHSHSSRYQQRDDERTVGDYALHVLFTSFIAQAEAKLNESITSPFEPEPQSEQICGPGVDPAFDQIIAALGHITKTKPKSLVDSMMLWRKGKSDAAGEARSQLQQMRLHASGGALHRRNAEPVQDCGGNGCSTDAHGASALALKQEYVAQAERRSTVSIYILCRVLLEVISRSTLGSITPETEDKLEGIMFGQIKGKLQEQLEPEHLAASPLKLANWNLFAQLLGAMGEINFHGVTQRFVEELQASVDEIAAKSSKLDMQARTELVLAGMKHLRLQTAPADAWTQTCEFLGRLGQLFGLARGSRVKSAFCQALDTLLLPMAASHSLDFSHPLWKSEVLGNISPRLAQMFVKPRHWSCSFPLTATMVCVSPPESFSSQWLQLIYPLQNKIKDRLSKPLCLQVVSRLLWTYLYRTNDPVPVMNKKLDEVVKLVLPTTKRTLGATDSATSEPLIHMIRYVGYRNPEYCFRTILFPLLNAEHVHSTKDVKIEHLDPERSVVGIRALLAVMSDLEKGERGRPPFPTSPAPILSPDRIATCPLFAAAQATPPPPRYSDTYGDENPIKPFAISTLPEAAREYYVRLCEVLGKITIACDHGFGGQATVDEKFTSPGPKTPSAESFAFSRRDEHASSYDQRLACYELFQVAVQALPRCRSPDMPFNSLINLLCTGTAHVQAPIAHSSAQSLKAIARQAHAHQVTTGFARFIFNFDDRYSTMSDGGMLGPGHMENTLRLYVELLQIWIDETRQKTTDKDGAMAKRAIKLDLASLWAEADQVEAHGLFFLCSQSRRVRCHAISVLRLMRDFDAVVANRDAPRLIDLLENESKQLMDFQDEQLTVAERSRLQRGRQNSNGQGALVELCTSDVSYDTALWHKAFANFVRLALEKCPFSTTIGRNLICNRILQMYPTITVISEPTRGLHYPADSFGARTAARTPTTQPEVVIEQWKLYLVFACTTMADPGPGPGIGGQNHGHPSKASRPAVDRIVSARTLFKYLNPLLCVPSSSTREAIVSALGSINMGIYRTLLEELQGQVNRCNDEARMRLHQRNNSHPPRNKRLDLLRTEITHVFKRTCHFLRQATVYQDPWILSHLTNYTRDLKLFLMDGQVQMDWGFQSLRRHYCGLMEGLYEGIRRNDEPSQWMTFECRKSAFSLMEDWCGFSPNQAQIKQREDGMRQSMMDQQSMGERGTLTAAMEIEKRNLRTAALSAMAALCAGPIRIATEGGAQLQFDMRRMLAWIEAIFSSGSDRVKTIGRRALRNLIVHNQDVDLLLAHSVSRCYLAGPDKVLESYFTVVSQVLLEGITCGLGLHKLFGLCLFTLGNDASKIRSQSVRVLRALEEGRTPGRSAKLQDFDIRIADKTRTVYQLAQLDVSKRLAKQHMDLAIEMFSDLTLYFKDLPPSSQRNVIAVMLPWIQSVELQVDPNGGAVAESYVLLAHMLTVTIQSSPVLHNEVQALWQALATGPHAGNVRLMMDFVMSLCLERREQNFVEYAKQIVVFLANANSSPGSKVVEFLMMHITPKSMVPAESREPLPAAIEHQDWPYMAHLHDVLPMGAKQAGFSLGQLSVILLVDLMVAPLMLAPDKVPVLLQVVVVLWDHYTALVQEQAREMLVHLMHELVLSRLADDPPATVKTAIEDLVDAIRRHDRSVVWGYEDNNGKTSNGRGNKVPPSMAFLTAQLVQAFELTFPAVKEQWARVTLTWATSCPVRHLACRSFQIFRCIVAALDQYKLADMLARLSNTIADEDAEIQTFSMEILITLKTLIAKLDVDKLMTFPQLFWTTCACLESINECEFTEALEMLNEYLDKVDFQSTSVRRLLYEAQPPKWDGPREGLQALLYKGLRSSACLEPTLSTLDKLAQLPNDALIGDESRLLLTVLANVPRFLHAMEHGTPTDPKVVRTAEILLGVTSSQGLTDIALVLDDYLAGHVLSETAFIHRLFGALRLYFLPALDFQMLTMLMGLLTNSHDWIKAKTLHILRLVIPDVDMSSAEIADHGLDMISPLLRLLQGDFCMEALQVMDNIMPMPGTSMDKQHLRMSISQPTSRGVRKEFERTQSLFGIPEPTGWAIPVPAKKTDSTRANIHAIFYMCQSAEGPVAAPTPAPDVAFHAEVFPYAFAPSTDRADTMTSDDARIDLHPGGHLTSKLDKLDDFFDDDIPTSPPSDGRSSKTITEFSPDTFDPGAQLYDDQILPILHGASETTSFQNSFADRPTVAMPSSAVNTMNPGAFSAEPCDYTLPSPSVSRPGLPSRSITSPSAPSSYQPGQFPGSDTMSDDEGSEVFSEGEDDKPHVGETVGGGGQGSFFLENMIKPLTANTRSRMRRTTGERSNDGNVPTDRYPLSQQVAKLPAGGCGTGTVAASTR